jgi:hypothetical protein
MSEPPAATEVRGAPAPAVPVPLRLGLIVVIGVVAGGLTLGTAPWGDQGLSAEALLVLLATGLVAALARSGLRGLISLDLALLAGMAIVLSIRVSMADSGLGGVVSLLPVSEWRIAFGASAAAGLFLPAVGWVVGGRLGAASRRIRRPILVLGSTLAGSLVMGATLALVLGATKLVIPEGAVILHVTVTDGEISLEPATVPAGEVYFIRSQRGHRFEGPFLESGTGPEAADGRILRGPLSDEDVARLQSGQLPQGRDLAEEAANTPVGEPPAWPTPDEFGGNEWLAAGRYAWWTLEVVDFPGNVRIRDVVIFTVE